MKLNNPNAAVNHDGASHTWITLSIKSSAVGRRMIMVIKTLGWHEDKLKLRDRFLAEIF